MICYDANQIWEDILADPSIKNVCRLKRADIDERISAYGYVDSGSSDQSKMMRAHVLSQLVHDRGDAPKQLPSWWVFSTMQAGDNTELNHVVRCRTKADADHQYRIYSALRGFTSQRPRQLDSHVESLLLEVLKGGDVNCL